MNSVDKDSYEKLSAEKIMIEGHFKELQENFSNTSESIDYFKKEIESLTEIKTDLTEQIEKLKADSEHELKQANEKYQEIEKILENIKENSSESNRQPTTELDSLKTEIETINKQIETLITEKEQV